MDTIQTPSNEEYKLNLSEQVNTDLHSDIVHGKSNHVSGVLLYSQ